MPEQEPTIEDGEAGILKVILDSHADCCDNLARLIASRPFLTLSEIRGLDAYAVLVGRENVPPEVWAAMSRGEE